MAEACFWNHPGEKPHFPCHVDGHTVCARCCVEHCRVEAPSAFAACQAAGHPTWPPKQGVPRKLVAIEGYWDADRVFDRTSVGPFLQGLAGIVPGLQIAHRRVGTVEEFRRLVRETLWSDEQAHDVPVYYLAFHGARGHLDVGEMIDIEALCACFAGYGAVDHLLYFSSCATFGGRWGDKRARRLLEAAGSRAVVGYGKDVDWSASMLVDLHFMFRFFTADDPWNDLPDIGRALPREMKIAKDLGWKIVTAPLDEV